MHFSEIKEVLHAHFNALFDYKALFSAINLIGHKTFAQWIPCESAISNKHPPSMLELSYLILPHLRLFSMT